MRRLTRREIIDRLSAGNLSWSGRLQEDEFLARLNDLERLPSKDDRFKTAAGDIWKHRVMNDDGSDDWVFYDDRFSLLRCPYEEFLRFLCEMVYPIVRPSTDEATGLVIDFNEQLTKGGSYSRGSRYPGGPSSRPVKSVAASRCSRSPRAGRRWTGKRPQSESSCARLRVRRRCRRSACSAARL